MITIEDLNWSEGRHEQLIKIVVELDGHDYHERTKEQADYDKSRDRSIPAAGHGLAIYGSGG